MDAGSVVSSQTNLTSTADKADKAVKVASKAGLSASSALSAVQVKSRPPAGAPTGAGQTALPGFGPDPRDLFRFTWWNTSDRAEAWIEHRGKWRAGLVIGRGRKYVEVAIVGANGKRRRVRKLYSELRRAR